MANKDNQFSSLQRHNLEAALRLVQISIENSQRMMELQVETAKHLFEDSAVSVKSVDTLNDPKKLMESRAEYARKSTEMMLNCARQMAELANHTQVEVGKLIKDQLSCQGQDVFEAIQQAFKGMPIGDHNAMDALQTAMDTNRKAFEKMTQLSTEAFQQFTQMVGGQQGSRKK